MRTITSLCSVLALTFALGCGGGDSDGDSPDAAPPTVDAGPSFDAPPTNPPISSGLGEICTMADPTCTSAATPQCVPLQGGTANTGYCTLDCATIPEDGAPDAAAHQICAAQYTGTTGTPACVIGTTPVNGMVDLVCGIACGVSGTNDLGACPGGFTCTNNTCIP